MCFCVTKRENLECLKNKIGTCSLQLGNKKGCHGQ